MRIRPHPQTVSVWALTVGEHAAPLHANPFDAQQHRVTHDFFNQHQRLHSPLTLTFSSVSLSAVIIKHVTPESTDTGPEPTDTGPEPAVNLEPWLETVYGRVERLGGGAHSRVFRLLDEGDGFGPGERIVKVYRRADDMNVLEAANMRRAGLARWLIGTSKPWVGAPEILMLRYFPGVPISADLIPGALPELGAFLRGLHAHRSGRRVDVSVIRRRLEQFRTNLLGANLLGANWHPEGHTRLEQLFDRVQRALDTGLFDVAASLCHLDLWRANVLYGNGRVLVVDWGRSNWDDPARDYAVLMTGTFDQLPAPEAVRLSLELTDAEGVSQRFPAHVALQTLSDLDWFVRREPDGFKAAFDEKVPRALMLE